MHTRLRLRGLTFQVLNDLQAYHAPVLEYVAILKLTPEHILDDRPLLQRGNYPQGCVRVHVRRCALFGAVGQRLCTSPQNQEINTP